jgi:butyrate kinase
MTDGELEFFQHTFHHFGEHFSRLQCSVDGLHFQVNKLSTALQEIKHLMSTNPPVTQAQFEADMATLNTNVTTLITAVTNVGTFVQQQTAAIADLKQQIANGQTPDFTALDASANAINTEITTATASLVGDVPAPTPPVTTPPTA